MATHVSLILGNCPGFGGTNGGSLKVLRTAAFRKKMPWRDIIPMLETRYISRPFKEVSELYIR
jgi:hypothetical protein